MRRRRRETETVPELNLKPAMNMILILIPLLLLTMEAIKISTINVAVPSYSGQDKNPPVTKPDELKLTIALTDRGITLFAKGAVLENKNDPGGPTIPKIESSNTVFGAVTKAKVYDWQKLTEKLHEIKKANPAEDSVIITAEPTVKYRDIIKAMDSSREKNIKGKIEQLFPKVSISSGIA